MIEQFKSFLLKSNLAPNTIDSYVWTVVFFRKIPYYQQA